MYRYTRCEIARLFVCLAFLATVVAPALAIEEGLQELRLPPLLVEQEYKPNTSMELPPPTYPLGKVEQLPFQGAWHEFVNVTTGGLVFSMPDIKLAGRMPIEFGRIYDSKISDSLPPPPPGGPEEARWTEDLGPNWILGYTAYIMPVGFGGLTMATTDGDVIYWTDQGDGTYLPQNETASKHMLLEASGPFTLIETQTDGTRWHFTFGVANGSTHALTKIEDRSGNYVEMVYGAGRLMVVQNSDGSSLTLHRDNTMNPELFPVERVTSISVTGSVPLREVAFDYNTDGLLTDVTDITGNTWEFTYASNDKLTAAIDPTGDEYLSASYDIAHRIATYEAQNGPWTFTYSTNRTFVDDALSNQWEYRYLSDGITYKIIEPAGGIHLLTFDAERNPSGYTDPEGVAVSWDYNDDHLPESYTPAGVGANSIDYTYDSIEHWVDSVTTLDGGVTSFTRDTAGRVLTETKPDGGQWTATYDATDGDRLTLTLPLGNVSGGSGYEWSFGYDTLGQITSATDPTGRVFSFGYHETGELASFKRPDHMDNGTLIEAEWAYARDNAGRLTGVTDPLGNTWTRIYDDAGRLEQHNGPEGTSLRYTYDDRHRVETVMVYNDGVTDPTTTYVYDAAGRLLSKTLPNGSTWTYGYDASSRLTSVTDPLSRVKSFGRDLAGRISSITHPGGQVVSMLRDAAGNLSQRTIPGGRVETFLYDPATGRLIQAEANIDSGAWIGTLDWDHDVMGRPDSVTSSISDSGGTYYRELQYAYDENGNRKTLTSFPTGEYVTYTYDMLDRLTDADSTLYDNWDVEYHAYSGHRTQVTIGNDTRAWTYDLAGRLATQVWNWFDEGTGNHSYSYDTAGRMTALTNNDTLKSFETTWNSIGLPTDFVEKFSGATVSSLVTTYDSVGQVLTRTRTEGSNTDEYEFSWDAAGRIVYARNNDDARTYSWSDTPADASAALRMWRSPTDPRDPSVETLYGFDGRLQSIYSHEVGAAAELQRSIKWAPVVANFAFESMELQPDDTTLTKKMIADVAGYYGEADSSYADLAVSGPVTGVDLVTRALRPQYGAATPNIDEPFGKGSWAGVPSGSASSETAAVTQFVSGLLRGRVEANLAEGSAKTPFAFVGALATPSFAPVEVSDSWLGTPARSSEQDLNGEFSLAQSAALVSENSSGVSLHGGTYHYDPTEQDEACIQHGGIEICLASQQAEVICLCEGGVNEPYSDAPSTIPDCCPFLVPGGANPPQPFQPNSCDFEFDQTVVYSQNNRDPDFSEGGVSLANGEYVKSVTDISVFSPHIPVHFTRTYRSGMVFEGDLGYKWQHNWNEAVVVGQSVNYPEECTGAVKWVSPETGAVDFYINTDGTVDYPPDLPYRIREVEQSGVLLGYEIRHVNGMVRKFMRAEGTHYLLTEIAQGSNSVQVVYDLAGRLDKIRVDSNDRLSFHYEDATSTRIYAVSNALDLTHSVVFEYSDCGELDTVLLGQTDLGYNLEGIMVADMQSVSYTYWNPDPTETDCNTKAQGHHMLTETSVSQLNLLDGTSGNERTVSTRYYRVGQAPAADGVPEVHQKWKVYWQCFGDKDCEVLGDADLVYDYTEYGNDLHDTVIEDHRLPSQVTDERHKYEGDLLIELIEDEGGLNRVTSQQYDPQTDVLVRTDYADGTCTMIDYKEVNGVQLQQTIRQRTQAVCDGPSPHIPDPTDRIVHHTYDEFMGRVRSTTTTEAFQVTGGAIPPSFDLDDPDIKKYTQFVKYDFDEGVDGVGSTCTDWDLDECPPSSAPDINGLALDDDNWFGNPIYTYRWVPADGNGRAAGKLGGFQQYRADGRPSAAISPDGVRTEYLYYDAEATADWNWTVSGHTYSAGGAGPMAATNVISNDPGNTETRTGLVALSARNQAIARQGSDGVRKVYSYGNAGRLLEEQVTCDPSIHADCDAGDTLRTTRYGYDLRGRLVRSQDFEGTIDPPEDATNERHVEYDDLGRPTTTIRDPAGGETPTPHLDLRSTRTYDGRGRVIKTVSAERRVICKSYDTLGRLLEVRRKAVLEPVVPDPEVELCDDAEDDPDDLTVVTQYDSMNRPIVQTDNRETDTYSWYTAHGELEYVSDGQPASALAPVVLGNPPTPAGAGNWYSQTSYDAVGRSVRSRFFGRRDPESATGGVFMRVSWQTYDTMGRPETVSAAIAEEDVDSVANDIIAPSNPPAGVSIATSTSYYDAFGRVAASADVFGRVTDRKFDAFGAPRKTEQPANRICEAAGVPTATSCRGNVDCAFGEVCEIDNSQSSMRDYSEIKYDDHGRVETTLSEAYDPTGGTETRTGELHYDQWGRRVRIVGDPSYTVENDDDYIGLDQTSDTVFDHLGRVWKSIVRADPTVSPDDVPGADDRVTELYYDNVGRPIRSEQRQRDPAQPGTFLWVSTQTQYDGDRLQTALVDANGNQTVWVFDAQGRLEQMQYPSQGGKRQTLQNLFDGDLPTSVTISDDLDTGQTPSPDSLVRNITYDDWGRLKTVTASVTTSNSIDFVGTTAQSFGYDDLGQRIRATDTNTDFLGEDDLVSEFLYDSVGRLIEENQPRDVGSSSQVPHRIQSSFALDGSRSSLVFPEAFDSSANSLGNYEILTTFDSRGRIRSFSAPSNPYSLSSALSSMAEYEWVGGRPWSRRYPTNGTELRMFDDGVGVDPVDALGRVRSLRTVDTNTTGDPTIADFRYDYDVVGNLMYEQRVHEEYPGSGPDPDTYRTRAMTTDMLGRLASWAEDGLEQDPFLPTTLDPVGSMSSTDDGESWELDGLGNWSEHSVDGSPVAAYDSNSLNQYTQIDPDSGSAVALTHDWLGQLRLDPTKEHEYIWDAFGRLTQIWNTKASPPPCGALIAEYRYDALNRRVESHTPCETIRDERTRFYYDGWRAIEERTVLGGAGAEWETVRARYGFGLGLDQVLWMDRHLTGRGGPEESPGGPVPDIVNHRVFVHHDRTGSAIAVTNDPVYGLEETGPGTSIPLVEERFTYSAYGVPSAWWDPIWDEGTGDGGSYSVHAGRSEVGLPYLFTGQRSDPESGLHYYKNRFYDSRHGRFLRRDLIGYADGPSLYQYARGIPTVFGDPLGLQSCAAGTSGCEGPGGYPGGGGPGGLGGYPGGVSPGGPGIPGGNPNDPFPGEEPNQYVIGVGILEGERAEIERKLREACRPGSDNRPSNDICDRIDHPTRHIMVGRSGKILATFSSGDPWKGDKAITPLQAMKMITRMIDNLGKSPVPDSGSTLVKNLTAVAMLSAWLRGEFMSPTFDPEISGAMRDAGITKEARAMWYASAMLTGDPSVDLIEFGGEHKGGLARSGFGAMYILDSLWPLDQLEHFVGGASITIISDGSTLNFTIDNVASLESFTHDWIPNDSLGRFGQSERNVWQFSEPIDFDRLP